MIYRKPKMLLLLSLTTMLFAAVCKAQQVTSVTQLPDKSYIVVIDGVEHRAFGATKMRELETTKAEHDAFQADLAKANQQITVLQNDNVLLTKNVALAEQLRDSFKADFERSQEDAKRNFGLFIGERTLRQEATQFVPHGKVSGFGGKFLSFIDSGYGQSLFKLVIPTAQAVKVFTARCAP